MILHLLVDASVALLYAFCCACAGCAVLAIPVFAGVRAGTRQAGADLTTAFILGQGLLSQVLVLLGLVTDFTPWVVGGVLALAMVVGSRAVLPALIAHAGGVATAFRGWLDATVVWKAAGIVASVYAGSLLLGALVLPPSGDAEAFYFSYAKFIATGQRLMPFTGNFEWFSSIGMVGELHFAALMLLAGQPAAKAFAWVVAAAACAMLLRIGRACGLGARGQLVALLLVLTSTTFTAYVTDGKVELFASALGLAACFWALQSVEQGKADVPAMLAGFLTGLACVAKISYIPTLVPGVVLILVLRESHALRFASLVRWSVPFTIAAVVAIVPHMVKNAIFFGEPLAPFLSENSAPMINQVWFSAEATRWIVLTYPLALVFGQYPMQGGTLSFLALALLPLAIYLPRPAGWRDSPLVKVTLASLLGIAIWLMLRPSVFAPRYMLASLLLLFLLPSRALEHVSSMKPRPGILNIAITGSFAIALLVQGRPFVELGKDVAKFAHSAMPSCYGASPYCEALQEVNERLPHGARIYVSMYYAYWLRPDLLACRNTNAEIVSVKALPDAAAWWEELFARGFETVVIDKTSHSNQLMRLDPGAAPAWLEVRKVSAKEPLAVYALASRDPARKPAVACRPRVPAGWEVVRGIR